mgnify:CR=1 FL=1
MQNLNIKPPIYDPEAVQPMRDELTYVGFEELSTPDKVEEVFSKNDDKVTLLMINSVCGCAAGSARPGVTHSVMHNKIPDRLVTVFAGQDRDATEFVRENYLKDIPPSSPFVAMFKNDEPIAVLPRHHIEGRTPQEVAEALIDAFEKHCTKEGPAISEEAYGKLVHARACGSTIPKNEEAN